MLPLGREHALPQKSMHAVIAGMSSHFVGASSWPSSSVYQALVALRDYLPLHIYHHASNHLFGRDELRSASLMPQLRPELSNLRAYAAGNIEVRQRY